MFSEDEDRSDVFSDIGIEPVTKSDTELIANDERNEYDGSRGFQKHERKAKAV